MKLPLCPYCGMRAKRANGCDLYPHRPDLWKKKFVVCFPCDARVGCHANGDPLGELANAELRSIRIKAHAAFDPKWKQGGMSRSKAYRWLSKQLGIRFEDTHIGMFDMDQCQRVIEVCESKPVGGIQ